VEINNDKYYHLRCDAVLSHRNFPAHWRHMSLPPTLMMYSSWLWHRVVC
jgi:hypothetical protein